jgi:hypothetical protein
MKTQRLKLGALSILTAAIALAPTASFCQEATQDKAATESADAAKPKRENIVFRGKVASVDKDAKTFTVGQRTFHVTDETKIKKAGKDATLADAVVGEEVAGQYKKGDGDKLMALSVRFGPKPADEKEE